MTYKKAAKLILLTILTLTTTTACRTTKQTKYNNFIVAIDAGHGGNDQGAAGHHSLEKNINLNLTKRLAKSIRKKCPRTEVIQIRPDDQFVTLEDRAGMANYFHADLFISIHSNAVDGWAQGTETFIHPKAKGTKAEKLAQLIEKQYTYIGRQSRGVKTANFAVLRMTHMPAVLTEIGFITNKNEEKYINSKKGQKQLADAIAQALATYIKTYH